MLTYHNCELCPRRCKADRAKGQLGFCKAPDHIMAARAALHLWEEPCISSKNGSGTVFFSGCTLRCVFCQNHIISAENKGYPVTAEQLCRIFLDLQEQGAHNINLVTPTHFLPDIVPALQMAKQQGLHLPIVYNCGGYERVETIRQLRGLVDVYLPDFKYMDDKLGEQYSNCANYSSIAKAAIQEMIDQCGDIVFDQDGIVTKGVIVRHLLLPRALNNAKAVVKYLYNTYHNCIWMSLMNQYTPIPQVANIHPLCQRVTGDEYEAWIDYAIELGVENAFVQEGDSSDMQYIPSFNGEGIIAK